MISKIIELIKRKRGYYERKAAWPSNLEVVSTEWAGGGKIDDLKSEHEQVIAAILLRLSEIERHCRSKVTREELVDLIDSIKEEWK